MRPPAPDEVGLIEAIRLGPDRSPTADRRSAGSEVRWPHSPSPTMTRAGLSGSAESRTTRGRLAATNTRFGVIFW